MKTIRKQCGHTISNTFSLRVEPKSTKLKQLFRALDFYLHFVLISKTIRNIKGMFSAYLIGSKKQNQVTFYLKKNYLSTAISIVHAMEFPKIALCQYPSSYNLGTCSQLVYNISMAFSYEF